MLTVFSLETQVQMVGPLGLFGRAEKGSLDVLFCLVQLPFVVLSHRSPGFIGQTNLVPVLIFVHARNSPFFRIASAGIPQQWDFHAL